MRTPDYTGQFKRDYKRETKGQHRATLDADLWHVLSALLVDQPFEPRHRDHALTGDWEDHRDCHVKPDQVQRFTKPLTLNRAFARHLSLQILAIATAMAVVCA